MLVYFRAPDQRVHLIVDKRYFELIKSIHPKLFEYFRSEKLIELCPLEITNPHLRHSSSQFPWKNFHPGLQLVPISPRMPITDCQELFSIVTRVMRRALANGK